MEPGIPNLSLLKRQVKTTASRNRTDTLYLEDRHPTIK